MSGRILITGGLGNLGLWISEYFEKQGFEVFILSSRESKNPKIITADISDLNSINLPLNLDYVIHLASFNEFFVDGYFEKALKINTLGTRNLLEKLKTQNIKKFVYFSTFHIYGKSFGNISEHLEPNPKNDYALTHLFAEYYVKNSNIPYTIFRLTNSYGSPKNINSSKWYLVLNDLTKMAFETQKIILKSNGKAVRDFIFMGDVAKIVEKSLAFKENSIFNLGSGKSTSILEIAKMVQTEYFKIYNQTLDIEINSEDRNEIKNLQVDISKLQTKINYSFESHFQTEIRNIFNLLESQNG